MSKVTNPLQVVEYCTNPKCGGEIFFGQKAIKLGMDLYCSNNCLCESLGAVVIKVDDNIERGDAEHENDPTG